MRPIRAPRVFSAGIANAVTVALVAFATAIGMAAPAGADAAPRKAKAQAKIVSSPIATPATIARPGSWCGEHLTRDDVAHQVPNGSHRFHAIYMLPADAQSRFGALASQVQAGAFAASSLIERTYGRAIRFDMGTSCGAEYLDITIVRSELTTAQLQAAARVEGGTLGAIGDAVAAAGFKVMGKRPTKAAVSRLPENFVVWLDGPSPSNSCGQAPIFMDSSRRASNWNNFGGKVAAVYLRQSGNEFCGARAVRHEIAHALGAVQPEATNYADGAHCNDAYEDTMCVVESPKVGGGNFQDEYFDYGNDDYWDPPKGKPLRWWTVNLSRFICPDATCTAVAPATGTAAGTKSPKRGARLSR